MKFNEKIVEHLEYKYIYISQASNSNVWTHLFETETFWITLKTNVRKLMFVVKSE